MDLFETDDLMDLRTDRLKLRRPRMTDAAALVPAINHWDVARWVSAIPHPYTDQDAQDFLTRIQDGAYPTWSIFEDDVLAGGIGIPNEFGYWLAPSAWGRGIATEAGRAVLAWHFENAANDVTTRYLQGNAGSARVLSKLGFREIGSSTCSSIAAGENLPSISLVLTQADWDAVR
ncbi:MAG: GNAT family N-acetyltransferase [Pseudomonadota bacterium]